MLHLIPRAAAPAAALPRCGAHGCAGLVAARAGRGCAGARADRARRRRAACCWCATPTAPAAGRCPAAGSGAARTPMAAAARELREETGLRARATSSVVDSPTKTMLGLATRRRLSPALTGDAAAPDGREIVEARVLRTRCAARADRLHPAADRASLEATRELPPLTSSESCAVVRAGVRALLRLERATASAPSAGPAAAAAAPRRAARGRSGELGLVGDRLRQRARAGERA